jgi:hypothetical protein
VTDEVWTARRRWLRLCDLGNNRGIVIANSGLLVMASAVPIAGVVLGGFCAASRILTSRKPGSCSFAACP